MATKSWRAKRYRIWLPIGGRYDLVLRRFRTRPERRTQRYAQVVVSLPFHRLREVVLQRATPRQHPQVLRHQHRFAMLAQFSLVFVGLTGALFCMTHMQAVALQPVSVQQPSAPVREITKLPMPKSLPASVPTAISIPSQNISASVMPVGQAADGSIQMPPLFDWTTGWYDHSPTPGQIGPAIIVGHVDTYRNISVFWRLRYVQPGDKIYVSRTDASTAVFSVTAIQQFNQSDFPTQTVYGNIPYAGLRLITCGGTFDEQTKSYTQNTVVFATLD